jgi:phosphoglycerate dehydrogenase-like enzyme
MSPVAERHVVNDHQHNLESESGEKFSVGFTRDFLNEAGQLAYGDIGLGLLDQSPLVTYRFLDHYSELITPEQIADVDALVLIYPYVKTETFARGAERLAFVGRCGVGYDRIDVAACTAADVALLNAPQAMRLPTASASLTLMLVLSKRLMELDRLTRQGRWDRRGEVQGFELYGRTLGIIGLGHTGSGLVELAAPFAMRVLAYSPHAEPDQARRLDVELVPLEVLLRESDFVCLHCRLTEETRGLIGARELALMKPTAYLINMARGPVVDHAALVAALAERRIAGAGLDVFYAEPLPADDPITRLDNVVLSPHWLTGTRDAFLYAGRTNCAGMLRAALGELPENIVNPDVINRPGFQAKLARFRR